jgi:short-subunit dehydrogenase
VIITGATSGIGREIAHTLLAHEANLLLTGRNRAVLMEMGTELGKTGRVYHHEADLSDPADIYGLVGYIRSSGLQPDILIHCAGVFHHSDVKSTPDVIINQTFGVNFQAPFILTRELLDMLVSRKGQILFVNSTACYDPKENTSVYAASKSALKTFADVLHKEVRSYGVSIYTIFPGMVATPMQELVCRFEGREYNAGKCLEPGTIAQLAAYLLTLPGNVELREVTVKPSSHP